MGSVNDEINRIAEAKVSIEEAIEDCGVNVPDGNKINTYSNYIRAIPEAVFSQFNSAQKGGDDKYIKSISQTNGVINAQTGGLANSESSGLMSAEDKVKLDSIEPGSRVNVQSDWNEIDDSSDAYIKNKTHGETLIDISTTGSYTHTNDITYIKHQGKTFKLELGVETQINSGPPVHVKLTSPNTILIEDSYGWISANHPVTIIDIQKLDVKYLPDDVLNINVPQSDWNENNSVLPSYINGRTHWIEYYYNEISSPGRYNLDDYGAIYPVIISFNGNMYEVHEGENRLSWGPPLLVILTGNTLTIDGSSHVNEDYKVKIATHVEKLNPAFIPDTIYSAGTGLSLNETTFNLKTASDTELGGIKVGYVGQNQNYPIQLDADHNAYVTINKDNLGLSNVLIYKGKSSTEIIDEEDQEATINGSTLEAKAGDVVFYNNCEFVWNGSKWEKLGDDVTYKVIQEDVPDPTSSGYAIEFISNITQDADGVISPTKKSVQTASTRHPGIVSIGAQTFVGKKTFASGIQVSSTNGVSWNKQKISEKDGSLLFSDGSDDSGNYLKIDRNFITPRNAVDHSTYLDGISLGAGNYKFAQGYFLGEVYSDAGFYETSDARMKNFSTNVVCDLDKLSQLPKKYFTWKFDTSNKLHIGTSAQAVQEIYPELVNEDENGTLSVAYDKLSVVALAAVDKLHDEVKALKNKNQELEDRISKLENLLLYGKEY